MFSKIPLSFRTKIFLVLGAVVFLSIATVLLVLQETTKNRVRENIKTRFEGTIQAFRQLQELRTQFASDEIDSLAMSNAQFRTILSTASVGTQDFGFGQPTGQDEVLKDANLRLKSLLPFISIYQKSDVFLVTNAEGELLFTKADPDKFGQSLSNLPILGKVFDEGEGVGILNSRLVSQTGIKIFPPEGRGAIYQIVGKPVVFGEEIHGVVLWGTRLDRKTLESIKDISAVDIVLYSREGINASTLPPEKEEQISKLMSSNEIGNESKDSVNELSIGGERFMAMRSSILPGDRIEESGFVVLKSLTEELGFLKKLQITLLLIGGVILLMAIGLSFFLAGGVT
ncbi:MAG: hypothetical protein ACRENT_04690, partial [Thermodesulfobacteriota bacterium]